LIAIDTNVLLCYLLWDDEEQAGKAKLLINGPQPVLLTDIVLVETLWTLTGKKYQIDKDGVLALLNSLLEEPNICFEDGQTVWRALNDYRQSKRVRVGGKQNAAGFPDALIVNKGKFCIAQKQEVFGGVYTFDIAAQQIPGTKCP
jgi:predicted nucleic-acid-binding protein